MCTTCGCSDGATPTITNLETGETSPIDARDGAHVHDDRHVHQRGQGAIARHDPAHAHRPGKHHHHDDHEADTRPGHQHRRREHHHDHEHPADTHPGHEHPYTVVALEQQILAKNDRLAARNRGWFDRRSVLALNLVSSPGAGKTTLLARTLTNLASELAFCVVEGDQATTNDARRLRGTGVPVVQINTGTGCHLEADMLARGLVELAPPVGSVVMIENVGNLVCPALFDLGEHAKVAILSVTEGEDKPVKYPHMFRAATLLIISKTDLLPHVDFDLEQCKAYAREVNPGIEILALSATAGEGLGAWYEWIRRAAAGVPGFTVPDVG